MSDLADIFFRLKTEQNRLGESYSSSSEIDYLTVTDIQHQLFVLTLHGKLHLAPLSKGIHNVLDIATGTGIWAIDFGKDLSSLPAMYRSNFLQR